MYHIFHGKHRLILANNQDQIKTFNPDFILDQTINDALKKNSLLFKPRIIKKGNPTQKILKSKNKIRGNFRKNI